MKLCSNNFVSGSSVTDSRFGVVLGAPEQETL